MYQVLEELNKTSGISGSMVVGNDGIVIAADMDASFEEETVGALAASERGLLASLVSTPDGREREK